MTSTRIEKAYNYLRSAEFETSSLLVEDSFSLEEKVWIIRQRILDLDAELRLAEKSGAADKARKLAEKLREAQRALALLKQGGSSAL